MSGRIEPYGLYGDRCLAFIDETNEGWDSFITARAIPGMLGYAAKLTEDNQSSSGFGNKAPEVAITSPDGRSLRWDDQLLAEIQSYSRKKISLQSYDAHTTEPKGVDAGSILLITDQTLRKLEAMLGHKVDQRRFRANLMVTLDDDSIDEGGWIGKRIVAGSAELRVDIPCERCSMITVDPDTLVRDAAILKKVNEEMSLMFGVYASVVGTGTIQVGDHVYMAD